MQTMAVCPNCRILLTQSENQPLHYSCSKCEGHFFRSDPALKAKPEVVTKSPPVGEIPLACPDCLAPMNAVEALGAAKSHCSACGGMWQESAPIEPTAPQSAPLGKPDEELKHPGFVKSMLYGVSLPERILRSAVGMTAGTAREAAELMIPKSFQSSKSYEVAIRNSLNFLTDTIGGFESKEAEAADAGEHLAKKAIGNFVDMAGMATLHVSPMWILAAVSDIAYGSSTYLKELAVELEKQGVIDKASTIHHVDDILDAIQNTSGNMASSFDKPPLSVEELKAFVAETKASASQAKIQKLIPEHEMRSYWKSLHATASQENVSPFEAATAVAMHTAQQASSITMGGVTGVKVAGSLLQRNVLQHYQDSLVLLREKGFLSVLQSTYQPYVGQVWGNFSSERKSWTESLLDPENIWKLFK